MLEVPYTIKICQVCLTNGQNIVQSAGNQAEILFLLCELVIGNLPYNVVIIWAPILFSLGDLGQN